MDTQNELMIRIYYEFFNFLEKLQRIYDFTLFCENIDWKFISLHAPYLDRLQKSAVGNQPNSITIGEILMFDIVLKKWNENKKKI